MLGIITRLRNEVKMFWGRAQCDISNALGGASLFCGRCAPLAHALIVAG